jgi:hypothetical protein
MFDRAREPTVLALLSTFPEKGQYAAAAKSWHSHQTIT